jgi:hypothetical protein
MPIEAFNLQDSIANFGWPCHEIGQIEIGRLRYSLTQNVPLKSWYRIAITKIILMIQGTS